MNDRVKAELIEEFMPRAVEIALEIVAMIGGAHEGTAAVHVRRAGEGEVVDAVNLEFYGGSAVCGRERHACGQTESKKFLHSIPSHCCLAPPAKNFFAG